MQMSRTVETESQARRPGRELRHWIGILLLGCNLLATEAGAQNVLVVIADDLGVDGVAAYAESPTAGPTPVIDALAASGVLFRNFWTQPVCSPTRASLLTGLHPMQHGLGGVVDPNRTGRDIGLDATLPNLASMLAAAGYRSFALGKWHLAGGSEPDLTHPLLAGFDYHAGTIMPSGNYFSWPKITNGVQNFSTTYKTTDTTDDALSQIAGSEPWFGWVAYDAPHSPFHEPPADLHSHDLSGAPSDALLYHAMVEALDTELGRLLASVDLTDTTVIFLGDNGTPIGVTESPFLPSHAKQTLYEGGVNTPLIVVGQAVAPVAAGQESAALVEATDLLATVLEIAAVAGGVHSSTSFASFLSEPSLPSQRSWTYAETFSPNGGPIDPATHDRALRNTADYKLLRPGDGPDELYDLITDPFEENPLDLASLSPEAEAAYADLDAAIQTVPEPSGGGPLIAACVVLIGLRRRKRNRRRCATGGAMRTLICLFLVAVITRTSAATDGALDFDGVDDRVLVPFNASFPIEVFTLSAWIRALPANRNGAIIAHGEDDTSFNLSWVLYLLADGTLTAMLEDEHEDNHCYPNTCMGAPRPECTVSGDLFVADEQLHHVAATRDAAGVLALYIDGLVVVSCGETGVPSSNNQQFLSIGSSFGKIGPLEPGEMEPPIWFFSGLINDAAIWNGALSGSEISAIGSVGVDLGHGDLVGYWDFDEATGQTVVDRAGLAGDGFLGADDDPGGDPADPVRVVVPEPPRGISSLLAVVVLFLIGKARRSRALAAALLFFLGLAAAPVPISAGVPCDLLLAGGQIVSFDSEGSIAASIEITGNQIAALDGAGGCTQAIDLGDRVVIPGLIDNHVHWLARAYRPGHLVAEMDNAFSAADAVEILNRALDRAPAVQGGVATVDNFLTAIGGITPTQFSEGVLPNLTALDMVARPVLLSAGFNGPSSTNTEGRTFLQAQGVTVASDGSIGVGGPTADAIAALAAEQTFEDQTRGVLDLMAWSASLGLTTVVNFSDDSAAAEVLYDDGTAFTRMRHSLGARDSTTSFTQLNASIDAILGSPDNDFFRSDLIGEFAVRTTDISGNSALPANYDEAAALMATSGVSHHQHSIPDAEASDYLGVWESLGNKAITDLRWQLAHVFDMSVSSLGRLDALGGGFAMQHIGYTGTFNGSLGPPYRTAVEHGLPVGAGTDGGNLVAINPWLGIYFMTTGLNDSGIQRLPADETLSVMQAIELYTLGSAWFSLDDTKLGSLESGKLADLVVLTLDPFELETIGQLADLRGVKSALTVVDGEIVYSNGSVVLCQDSSDDGIWFRTSPDATCIPVPEPDANLSMLAGLAALLFLSRQTKLGKVREIAKPELKSRIRIGLKPGRSGLASPSRH